MARGTRSGRGKPPGGERVAGYHVFWSPPPFPLPDGRSVRTQRRGPFVQRGTDRPLVLSAAIDLKVALAAAELPAGDWILVPIDGAGRALDREIEIHVPRSASSVDLTAIILRTVERIDRELRASPSLIAIWEALDKPQQDEILARAQADVLALSATNGAAGATSSEASTEGLIDALVASALRRVRDRGRLRVENPSRVALCRTAVAALSTQPAAITEERIRAAVTRGDYDGAAARAIARVVAGHPLSCELAASILPGIAQIDVLLGLIAISSGDRWWALVELAAPVRFASSKLGDEQFLAAMYAAWRFGPRTATRPHVLQHVRSLARRRHVGALGAVVATLVNEVDDPALREVAAWIDPAQGASWLAQFDRALGFSVDDIIRSLPRLPTRPVELGPPPRPQADADDICPRGSWTPFAVCCGARAVEDRPANVVDVDWHLWLARGADGLEERDADRLPISDIARIGLERVSTALMRKIVARFTTHQRFDLAAACADVMRLRNGCTEEIEDSWRLDHLHAAVHRGHLAFARVEIAKIHDARRVAHLRLALAVADEHPSALSMLLQRSEKAIDDPAALRRLACALLGTAPALGVIVGRAAVQADDDDDTRTIVGTIEAARERLGAPPHDEIWRRWNLLLRGKDADRLAAEAADRAALHAEVVRLRDEIDRATSRSRELEDLLARRTAEAEAAARRAAQSDDERGTLRTKLDALKTIIAEGNDERADLRRRLAALRDESPPSVPSATDDTHDDDDAVDALDELPAGRVRIPRFERAAERALRTVPPLVAAEAIRVAGALAAGDPVPWRSIKQARGMASPLYMLRLGIHHRMLFRIEESALVVVDVVTREGLLGTLKRLRAAKR